MLQIDFLTTMAWIKQIFSELQDQLREGIAPSEAEILNTFERKAAKEFARLAALKPTREKDSRVVEFRSEFINRARSSTNLIHTTDSEKSAVITL
jgi:hypothetical protein